MGRTGKGMIERAVLHWTLRRSVSPSVRRSAQGLRPECALEGSIGYESGVGISGISAPMLIT